MRMFLLPGRRWLLGALLLLMLPVVQAAITVVGSSSAGNGSGSAVSSLTLGNPGALAGDVLLVQLALADPQFVSPSGWNSFIYDANGVSQQLLYRVAGASEPGSWTFSFSSSRAAGGLLLVRGANIASGNPIVASQSERGSGSSLTALAATVSTANSLVVRYFALDNGNDPLSGPATQHYQAATGAGPNGVALSGSSVIAASTGQSGNASATTASSASWTSLTVVLAPAAPPLLSWQMNESAWSGAVGEVLDSSGSGLHGRAFNNASTSNATPALAADSNGYGTCRYGEFRSANSRYLQINDNNLLDLSGSFTIGIWVRPITRVTGSGLMTILSKDENYEFHINASGFVNWWWQTSAGATREFNSTTAVPLNVWTHVAIRFSPGVQRIFINGIAAGSASFSGTPVVNSDPFQVGQDQGTSGRYFNGALDEVRVYNRALSDAEVLAFTQERPALCSAAPDHYELVYASNQALTCNPLDVTLRACQNSSCSSLYGSQVSVNLSPSGTPNNWSLTPLTFTGSTSVQFQRTTAGVASLGLAGTPLASNATQCIVAGVSASCAVSFAASGFILNVPNTLAAKPTPATLRAVKADPTNPQACVPGFASGSRSVVFTRSYSNPNTGTQAVSVNGTPVTTATPVTLNFDAAATAPLTVQYNDAGQVALTADYAPTSGLENGLLLNGTDAFVSKPYGLLLETSTDSACTADSSCLPYKEGAPQVVRRAGDPFSLRIKAVAWQCAGTPCVDEPLTAAALADNSTTPNFQLSNIALSSQLQAPTGGVNGTLALATYNHALGNQTTLSSQSISEVGVFKLTATPQPGSYLDGETVNASVSGLVGRFTPAYLSATGSASLTPSCGAAFSYQGQPMAFAAAQEPSLNVIGRNRAGNVTTNYDRGSFWKLAVPTRDSYLSVTGTPALDAAGRLLAQGAASVVQSGADTGDGTRSYRWSGETLQYSPALLPTAAELPFTAAIRQGFSVAALTDADGVCYGSGSACQSFSFDFANNPGSQVRLGRLSLGNAHGSELQSLSLPWRLESWQNVAGGSFQVESQDACSSAAVLGAPTLNNYLGNLIAGETTVTASGPSAGLGQLALSAPGAGNDGSVQGSFAAMPTWLYYDWDGSGRRAASGLASFGIYQGAAPLIFRREIYGQ